MRSLAIPIVLASLTTAQGAFAGANAAPDRTLAGLARGGLTLGGPGVASVALHLASGHEATGSLSPAGHQSGGQGAGMFVASRYDLIGAIDRIATASLTLTSYPAEQVTVASLDYDGPALAARDAIAVRMHLPGFARGMAIHRLAPGSAAPVWTSDYRSLPPDNLMLVWERTHRIEYQLLAPLAGGGLVGSVGVRGYEFGITMSAGAVTLGHHVPLFVFATALSPYQLTRKAYQIAFRDAGFYGRLRWEKGYPDAFTRLGWSSAPAYSDVTEADVLDAARAFRSRGLPLGFVLLGDGWLTVQDRRLAGFGAALSRFPDGLPGLVRKLRMGLGVRDVGVWHPLAGYRDGVDSRSAIGKAHALLAAAHGAYLPDPQGDADFFADWYTQLGRGGVDFVKVGDQAGLAAFTSGVMPLFDAGQGELRNLETAAVGHFGRLGGVNLLCSGDLALEAAYNWHYADLARASEPLGPQGSDGVKDRIMQDVFDSYWLSNFAYPDYGSFRSAAPESRFEAIAHAISGGPAYTSDIPGTENVPLLRSLTLADGTVLRVDDPGLPARDSLLSDPAVTAAPLLVWSQVRRPGQICGMVAAFNVDKGLWREDGAVKPADVDPMAPFPQLARFAVYDANARTVQEVTGPASKVKFWLPEIGADMFTIAPISAGTACLGLLDKLVGPAAIVAVSHPAGGIAATLLQAGDVGFYLQTPPAAVRVAGTQLPETAYGYDDHLLVIPAAAFKNVSGPVRVRVNF